ncbi:MAG: DUF3667 domain-containing protein [Saprospiraceae bacterium]|nr:DUF3667 domain-containing protein [Saprospiraceae bacterium]
MENHHCANCGTSLHGQICHVCGQELITRRWSTRVLVRQFVNHLTNIEKGFLYTGRVLFTAPGKVITDFWVGRTVRYYHPFRYVIIWTAISLLINFWLGIDDMLQASLQPDQLEQTLGAERLSTADQKFDSWLNVLVLLLIPVNSYVSQLLFRRHQKNYAEHLILNAFVLGQQGLIGSFTQCIFYLAPSLFVLFIPANFLVGWVYSAFVFQRVFREGWARTSLKALAFSLASVAVYFGLVALFSTIAVILS